MLRIIILLAFCLLWQLNITTTAQEPQPPAVTTVTTTKDQTNSYSLQDLEILAQEKSYYEFLTHALDILPHNRNYHWKDMVVTAATDLIKDRMAQKIFTPKDMQFIEDLFEWPTLKQEETFRSLRAQYGELYFTHCPEQEQKQNCYAELSRFWKKDPGHPRVGMTFAKLVYLEKKFENKKEEAWDYIGRTLGLTMMAEYCKDPTFNEMILKKLYQQMQDPKGKGKGKESVVVKVWIEETLSPLCWNELVSELKKILFGADKNLSDLTYIILKSQKNLKQEEEDLYLTSYILQGSIAGATLNAAWNNLEQLGKNYERRTRVFNEIKKLDPLPGELFASANFERKLVIIEYFVKNFPEYLDYYAKTCVNYLSGKQEFPNGNPTVYCKELFQINKSQSKNWITDENRESYLKITRNEKGPTEQIFH